jgi:hypothetical protein
MEHSEKVQKFPQLNNCPKCPINDICHNPIMQQRGGFDFCLSGYWNYKLDNQAWETLEKYFIQK